MGDGGTWDAETEDADRPVEDTDCPGAVGDDGAKGTVCNLQQIYQGLLGAMGLREEKVPPGRAGAARGAAVMGSLGDIARLHVRRGHNPDAPKNLRNARYFGSFVLRDGRQVPFGRSVGEYTSGKEPEAELGDGIAGAKIEAVMQAVAAFLGVEYALTGGPDEGLQPRKGEGGM